MKRFVQANYRNKKVGLIDREYLQYVCSVHSIGIHSFAHFLLLLEEKYFALSFSSFFLLETFVQIRFLFDSC